MSDCKTMYARTQTKAIRRDGRTESIFKKHRSGCYRLRRLCCNGVPFKAVFTISVTKYAAAPKYRDQESTVELSDLSNNLGQNREHNFFGQAFVLLTTRMSLLNHIPLVLFTTSAAASTRIPHIPAGPKEERKVESVTSTGARVTRNLSSWVDTWFQNNPHTVGAHYGWIPYLWIRLLAEVCLQPQNPVLGALSWSLGNTQRGGKHVWPYKPDPTKGRSAFSCQLLL